MVTLTAIAYEPSDDAPIDYFGTVEERLIENIRLIANDRDIELPDDFESNIKIKRIME